ncbi:G-type lectin S-receptor-like serine/threonine-protein kinase At1g11330 [Quercus suber]|uniref:G-type lectin S-receptor-like serine/threonine-protein kinase At1g11330 n=1 Tax=Quercus suber TaxID=58331 RepID=UPI0032DE7CE2
MNGKTKRLWIVIAIAIGTIALLEILFCILCYLHRRRITVLQGNNDKQLLSSEISVGENGIPNNRKKAHDVSVFSYECITTATNNFSLESKLGEGGFGPVYKGKLPTGQEIAVKRLSKNSGQGIIEFKNELILISKLQHTNLVKLLGCCIFGEERMLIYEYMPNKSLDYFLFDSYRSKLLDWNKRFNIIEGIAQGLIYLHKYSRLKVIHRDLKASNILLDGSMNPKISDFGMARIFKQNELEANTNRIVGTYGYMSPEYAMEGVFSIKSDVYSFGVLMLEIVSGRRNNSFNQSDLVLNLVGYAWALWREDKGLDLVDPTISASFVANQVLRCIHVSLLCVEEGAVDRPTMSDMLSMLTNESTQLPLPKKPAFSNGRKPVGATIPKKESEVHTVWSNREMKSNSQLIEK